MYVLLGLILALTCVNSIALAILGWGKFQEFKIRNIVKPSTELADFLADVKSHGYGVMRLEPDRLLYRGMK